MLIFALDTTFMFHAAWCSRVASDYMAKVSGDQSEFTKNVCFQICWNLHKHSGWKPHWCVVAFTVRTSPWRTWGSNFSKPTRLHCTKGSVPLEMAQSRLAQSKYPHDPTGSLALNCTLSTSYSRFPVLRPTTFNLYENTATDPKYDCYTCSYPEN